LLKVECQTGKVQIGVKMDSFLVLFRL